MLLKTSCFHVHDILLISSLYGLGILQLCKSGLCIKFIKEYSLK